MELGTNNLPERPRPPFVVLNVFLQISSPVRLDAPRQNRPSGANRLDPQCEAAFSSYSNPQDRCHSLPN